MIEIAQYVEQFLNDNARQKATRGTVPDTFNFVPVPDNVEDRVQLLRYQLEHHTMITWVWPDKNDNWKKERMLIVDTFSASVAVQVYDALSDKNKDTFNDMLSGRSAAVAWIIEKCFAAINATRKG